MDGAPYAPAPAPDLVRRRFTAGEFWRMAECGVLKTDERLELIGGEIVAMSPISTEHGLGQGSLIGVLTRALWGRFTVAAPISVEFSEFDVYEPDVLVLNRPPRPRRTDPIEPRELLLVGETARSSVRLDVETKGPVYARAGVPEFWVLDLAERRLIVFRDPGPEGYREMRALSPGEAIAALCAPDAPVEVADLV